jgi:hypothetical protein
MPSETTYLGKPTSTYFDLEENGLKNKPKTSKKRIRKWKQNRRTKRKQQKKP